MISINTEEQSQPPFMSRVYSARCNKTSKLQFPVNGVEECRTILFVFVIIPNLTKYNLDKNLVLSNELIKVELPP